MTHCSWPKMYTPACWHVIFTYTPISNAAYCHLCGLFVWGSVEIQKIVEQIVATAWEVCMQLAICESRAHPLFLHNHGWASWHCWRSSPALGARQPPQWRWQQQSKLCTLKCCLHNRRELKQLRENMPAVCRTLALAALDKV